MATIREVSRIANVSMATVSRVLNGSAPVAEATKVRVLSAMHELGYTPNAFARSLATNRSSGIGVVVNAISSPYFGAILTGIEEVVESSGMHLMVSSGHAKAEMEAKAVSFLLRRRSDALILCPEETPEAELLVWSRGDTPVIVVGRSIAELEGRCVYLDNEKGGFMATQHLLEHGHRRIAHITGPLSRHDSRARLAGYRRALEQAGLDYAEGLVLEGNYEEEGGRFAAQRLMDRGLDFSAIFAANDQTAAGAMWALREAGLDLPRDVSIVGYDDVMLARYLYPPLTTVRQPLEDMGRAAAKLALVSLGYKHEPDYKQEGEVMYKFEPQLIVRSSVVRV